MTARIIPFPLHRHPVRIAYDDNVGWYVEWRGVFWVHDSYGAARIDAARIAGAHHTRIIDCARKKDDGGAAC